MKTLSFYVALLFLFPALSYPQTDSLVILERWDLWFARYPTGTILNNSSVGIYQPVISFTFRDKVGKVIFADKIYDLTVNVVGQFAVVNGNYVFDYIPPKGRAYFQGWTDIPNFFDIDSSRSEARLSWKWAQDAVIDTSVSVLSATSTVLSVGRYDSRFSGEVINRNSYPVRIGRVVAVVITKDGKVYDIKYESVVDDQIPAGKTSAFSIGFDSIVPAVIGRIHTATSWQPVPPAPPPPRPRLLGDLDGDGDVDFDDFFIFAQQFGKKQ